MNDTPNPRATPVDTDPPTRPVELGTVPGAGGVVWSISPGAFHTNLVVLEAGGVVEGHRNDAVDVLLVVLAGSGSATVDDESFDLVPTTALLLRRGSWRAIAAGDEAIRYLTIHAERGPMGIGRRGHTDV